MGLYNRLLEHVLMPIGDLINGSSVMSSLKRWRKISSMSEEEISTLQRANLLEALEFATSKIPYYTTYRKYENTDPVAWLKFLPVMRKKDLKDNLHQLTSKPHDKLIKKETSGSSGIQGITYMDENDQSLNRAIQMLWWEWAGWKIGSPVLQTGMTARRGWLKSIKDVLLRTRYYVAFGLSDDDSLAILRMQKGKSNFVLAGYASSLYVLAKVAERNKIDEVKFDVAISWGDKMFPHYRKQIQKSFNCRVNDTYACSEGMMIAAQKDLDYYYIMTPHIYLELLDENGNEVEDGELGYVVVSRLDARSMPLLRYYTGDLAVKLPRESYPQQREFQFPLLERIIGRDTDIVYTRTGKYMIVHFFTAIFEYIPEIVQFRVIQYDLDSMVIEYISSPLFNQSVLRSVEQKIHAYLDEPFKVEWRKVDVIPSTASGKPQIIQSFLRYSK